MPDFSSLSPAVEVGLNHYLGHWQGGQDLDDFTREVWQMIASLSIETP